MDIEKYITLLRKEYERAKTLEYVRHPIAFALFKVWKLAESRGV